MTAPMNRLQPRTRPPTSVTVFAVLNIIFGALGLMGVLAAAAFSGIGGEANPVNEILESHAVLSVWNNVGMILGVLASLVLLGCGIGMLQLKPWARKAAIGWAIYGIVAGVVGVVMNALFMYPALAEAEPALASMTAVMSGFGAVIGMVYPVLLWYFMTRPRNVEAFERRREVLAEVF